MDFVARKPLTLLGIRYRAGEPVDLERITPVLRRRLMEQKRVVPRAESAAGPAVRDIAALAPDRAEGAKPGTCGWYGGVRKDGVACPTVVNGLCRWHRN